ncbi:hypothetical protein I5M32_03505 [Pedobacter sp. SD-b]|uniref:Uncharacterized protein n=1 Tax=Pedobacter segetis TaxID=2793069 RepID=A0ABS1BGQ1_9SPHI|nr:hypothetical protein [Pedobacter segetis]MBK0382015.1 hypothetical protein [Pedobacter segetis]
MISKKKDIIIIAHDLITNRTFSARYHFFIKSICNSKSYHINGIDLGFPYQTNPINSVNKLDGPILFKESIITLNLDYLNPIQKLLIWIDKNKIPYFFKKIVLALHIIIYKSDQWLAKTKEFNKLGLQPQIIISGGSGGIIKTCFKMANKYNSKLILDYRDPWNYGYHLLETNNLVYRFKKYFTIKNENKYLDKADQIITVSESLKSFFPLKYQSKITVIENGSNYEEAEVLNLINRSPTTFNIVYLGTIYNDQLHDETFFESVKNFIALNDLKHDSLRLNFLGAYKNPLLPKLLNKHGLSSCSKITDRLSNEDLLPFLLNASMFLHLKYGQRTQIITSKNADYLMFRKPILLPVSDNGDIAESMVKYKSGYVCNGVKETLTALNKEYDKFLKRENIMFEDRNMTSISRTEISKKLIEVLEKL